MQQAVPGLRQTARNISANWLYRILRSISSVVLAGIATRVFDFEHMGIVLLSSALAAHITLLDIGTSSALPRMLPRLLVTGDTKSAEELVSTAMAVIVPISLVALLLSPVLAWAVANYSDVPDHLKSMAFYVFLATGGFACLGLPLRIGVGLLATVNRMDIYFLLEIAGQLLKSVVALAIFFYMPTVIGYAIALAAPLMLAQAAETVMGMRRVKLPRINLFRAKRWALRELLHMCGASIVISMASIVMTQSASLIVGFLAGPTEVATMAFPMFLVTSTMAFATSFGVMLTPVANALHGTGETARMRTIVTYSTRLAGAAGLAIAVILIFATPTLLPLWLGHKAMVEGRLDTMINLVTAFSIGYASLAPASMLRGTLLGTQNPWWTALAEVSIAILSSALGFSLYAYTDLGLLGLVGGLTAGQIISGVVIFPLMITRKLEISYLRYTWATTIVPAGLSAIAFVIAYVIGEAFMPPGIWRSVAEITVFTVLWVISTYAIVLHASVRERLHALINAKFGGVPAGGRDRG